MTLYSPCPTLWVVNYLIGIVQSFGLFFALFNFTVSPDTVFHALSDTNTHFRVLKKVATSAGGLEALYIFSFIALPEYLNPALSAHGSQVFRKRVPIQCHLCSPVLCSSKVVLSCKIRDWLPGSPGNRSVLFTISAFPYAQAARLSSLVNSPEPITWVPQRQSEVLPSRILKGLLVCKLYSMYKTIDCKNHNRQGSGNS